MKKDKVLTTLEDLPDEFPVEALIERLLFIQKVEEGLQQSAENQTIPFEEAKKRLQKWYQ